MAYMVLMLSHSKMELLFLLLCIIPSNGFLLEGKTNVVTTISPPMSDRHYNMILDLLMDERHARQKQDQIIEKLQQDLLATKEEVTQKYIAWNKNNGTLEKHYLELENATQNLEKHYDTTRISFDALKKEYIKLQNNYTLLEKITVQIESKNLFLENKTHQLENEIKLVTQLKTVSNLQSVYNVWNETKHLEDELRKTNYRLSFIANDADARKQDFVALYNRHQLTDKRLDNVSATLQDEIAAIENGSNHKFVVLSNKVDLIRQRPMNISTSEKVILAARLAGGTYSPSQKIQIEGVEIAIGIQNIETFKNSGIFTCQSSGVYQISVFITTTTKQSLFRVYKNGHTVAQAYNSFVSSLETGTTIFVEKLNIGDIIYVTAHYSIYIYGGYESGICIVQLH